MMKTLLRRATLAQKSESARVPGKVIACATGSLLLIGLAGALVAQPRIEFANPPPERRVARDSMLIEAVRIEGALQAWVLQKICLDGQAYWIGFNETTPTGITPAYKDGRLEQCPARPR